MANALILSAPVPLPALVVAAGEQASTRFLEFFAAAIRNPNTRRAYARDFYLRCTEAFIEFPADSRTLYLPMETVISAYGNIEQL